MHRLSTTSSRALRRAAAKAQPKLTRGAHKEIKFSNDGRAAILRGVDTLANAVSVTLGPKGTMQPFQGILKKMMTNESVREECHYRAVVWWTEDHEGWVGLVSYLLRLRFTDSLPSDGVTVAKAITLKDKFENLGARQVLNRILFLTQLLIFSQSRPGCSPKDQRNCR